MRGRELIRMVRGKDIKWIVDNLCMDELGAGAFRDVYSVFGSERYVIKIEREMKLAEFANAMEWRNYIDTFHDREISGWLAPCLWINEMGQVLIQRRVRQYSFRVWPTRVPAMLTDIKKSNFGWIGNRFVCCDYSYFITNTRRLKKVKW